MRRRKSRVQIDTTCLPLTASEYGRGVHLPASRKSEIVDECCRLISNGVKQDHIGAALNISMSRLSRWCREAVRKHGDASATRFLRCSDRSLSQTVWARVGVKSSDECWPWTGFIKSNGYGSLNYRGKTHQAHRVVYEILVAPIRDGMVIDHVCSRRDCVNPRHLHQVKQGENLYRAYIRRDEDE